MRLSTSVRRVRCASLSSAAALDLRDDFAAARHRRLPPRTCSGLVGRLLTPQQLDSVGQQCIRDPVASAARALEHIAQQPNPALRPESCDRPTGSQGVAAPRECGKTGTTGLRPRRPDPRVPRLPATLAATRARSHRSDRELADHRSETACSQHVERGIADFAGYQSLDQPDPGRRVFGGHGEVPGDHDFAVQQFGYRHQLIGRAFPVP